MVFSTCSARLCHKCHRPATWIASGAPRSPASAYAPAESRQITLVPGCSLNQAANVSASPVGQHVDRSVGYPYRSGPCRSAGRVATRSHPLPTPPPRQPRYQAGHGLAYVCCTPLFHITVWHALFRLVHRRNGWAKTRRHTEHASLEAVTVVRWPVRVPWCRGGSGYPLPGWDVSSRWCGPR